MYFIVFSLYKWCSYRFNYVACVRLHKIMPIMLALYLMLLHIYYAINYAGIIDSGLVANQCLYVPRVHDDMYNTLARPLIYI